MVSWDVQARHPQPRREELLTRGWLLAEEHGSSQNITQVQARADREAKSSVLTMEEEGLASTICKAKRGPIPRCVLSRLG